jgi:excisionase family DNA binding protein
MEEMDTSRRANPKQPAGAEDELHSAETVSVDVAAARLGIDRLTLYAAIRRGEAPLPVIRIGRRILIPRRALERLLDGQVEPLSASGDTEIAGGTL